jgi:hypothetical protein
LREAAIGFLFDRDETCAAATACVLVEEGPKKPVSSATILRLERMRDWVAGRRREGIDAALRALRTDVAAPAGDGAPSGAHFHDIAERAPDVCVATPVDGAGAESLVARARTGKRVAVAGVLIKEGVGVADAWVRCNLTRRQSDEMLACLEGGVAHTPVSLQYWEKRLSDALALNLAHAPPPFGLVQVVEALGISFLRPARIEASALADGLLSALPEERTSEEAQAAAARASWTWDERIGVVETWFEAGEEIDALLAPLKGRKAREEAVHNRLLERREIWARRLSLSAAVLKEAQAGMLIADWIDMALMARELACEDHPRGGAPVLMQIAARTVDVFEAHESPSGAQGRSWRC